MAGSPRRYLAQALNLVNGQAGADYLSAVGPALVNVANASTPNTGDVLTALDNANAIWQAPSGGGIQDDPTVRTSGFTASVNTRYFIHSGFSFTVFLPSSPATGDVVAFAGVNTGGGNLTLNGNGNQLIYVPGSVGASITYTVQFLDLEFRYESGFWHSVSTSVAAFGSSVQTNALIGLEGTGGYVQRFPLSGGYSTIGRVGGQILQELYPYHQAHNLYGDIGSTVLDTAVSAQTSWLSSTASQRAHFVTWQGTADLLVQGVNAFLSTDFRPDKVVLNNTSQSGNGTFRHIIWKNEDTGASSDRRIRHDAPSGGDAQDFVQGPGAAVLLRYSLAEQRWVLAPGVTSGRVNRSAVTTSATPSTIHTHYGPIGIPLTHRVIMYKVQVEALCVSGTTVGDSALFDISALFYRNNVGTVVQKDVTFVNGPYKDAGAAAWNVTFNISGSDIQMQVTGDSGDTIRWRVVGNITEHG